MEPEKKKNSPLTASFVTGAIALVFLILGYQVALFVHKAAVTRLVANRDHPDTVYVYMGSAGPSGSAPEANVASVETEGNFFNANNNGDTSVETEGKPFVTNKRDNAPQGSPSVSPNSASTTAGKVVRKNAQHAPEAVGVREKASPRKVESFRFNPNTVSVEDLQRLGFSEKQAQSIDHYRQKGGRFRRPADFAKSYVVADSVYARLEPFIDIPRLDINRADSVALLALPGIGPYFAGKVVQYRKQLGGYSCTEQLMDIWHFDQEKYDGIRDLITCSTPEPYPLWTLPEAALASHPYISRAEAHGIVLYRQHHSPDQCTLEGLCKSGVLSEEHARSLSKCIIKDARLEPGIAEN